LQKRVAEEKPDSLRLLVEVGGQGAFVAAFRNRAEIILALYPQLRSPRRWRSRRARIRSADVAMAVLPSSSAQNPSQGVNNSAGLLWPGRPRWVKAGSRLRLSGARPSL
jgi:hypothetical protein